MQKTLARPVIRLRGVRHNNLKNFDLDLPLNRLVVITGLSGSGKSSLAFDTLFAEGQRRYIETFSPYARQFFDRMDKPQVDSIEGIPPAIAIEQRNAVRTTRSTVGTMTEICDYMKMLWPHVAQLHCRQCGRPVRKDSAQQIWLAVRGEREENRRANEVLITFDLPLSDKLSLEESLALVAKQGYQRLLLDGQILRLEEVPSRFTFHASRLPSLTVIQDRLTLADTNRARFVEACEQAYHFGKGKLAIHELVPDHWRRRAQGREARSFSPTGGTARIATSNTANPHPRCSASTTPSAPARPAAALAASSALITTWRCPTAPERWRKAWSGPGRPGSARSARTICCARAGSLACPRTCPSTSCRRSGRTWSSKASRATARTRRTNGRAPGMASRATSAGSNRRPTRCTCASCSRVTGPIRLARIAAAGAFSRRRCCTGVTGEVRRPKSEGRRKAEVRSPKGRVRPRRLKRAVTGSLTLADFYQLPIRDALPFIAALAERHRLRPNDPLGLVLNEVRSRLSYLNEVGLGYLTLDRPTRTLSGGETERVNLTTCLGTRLVNTLFVLDEPSVGLHPRDTERLVRLLQQLRNAGNTVVVVEHEASVIRAAEQIVDLGPGHGATGGEIVFQGTYPQLLKSKHSLTGQYLSGRRQIEIPQRRPVIAGQASRLSPPSRPRRSFFDPSTLNDAPFPMRNSRDSCPTLKLAHATRNNLNDLSVEIPLGRFVCVTGVSGSGKTTLVREVLLPALVDRLKSEAPAVKASDRLSAEDNGDAEDSDLPLATRHSPLLHGSEHLSRVVLVDQSILGKTPRSNPAVYIGAFDDIRDFFAQSELARQRGLNASAFSFNSPQGQCERCRGAGFEKIEMQFLSDVFIRCPDCNGRRYRAHILEVKLSPMSKAQSPKPETRQPRDGKQGAGVALGPLTLHASRFTFHASRFTPLLHRRRARSHRRGSHRLPGRVSRISPGPARHRGVEAAGRSGARLPQAGPAHQHPLRR